MTANVVIAVVEDDQSLLSDMVEYLSGCGFDVHGAGSGADLDEIMAAHPVELVILDVNLPGEGGFEIAQRLRRTCNATIVMCTSRRDLVDRIVGLEVGADVYLPKPVEFRELEAQVRALLRRRAMTVDGDAPTQTNLPVWVFDTDRKELVAPGGAAVALTSTENKLMELLSERPGIPCDRDRISRAVYGEPWDPSARTVDALIRRLRVKVQTQARQDAPLVAAHGVGYALTPGVTRR